MIKISENLYDTYDPAIAVVGDSNLTRTTSFPTGTNSVRVNEMYYDWRDRLVASKSGVKLNGSNQDDASNEGTNVQRIIFYNTLDNLGETTKTDQYDGDAVAMTNTNNATIDLNSDGVPDAPGTNKLRAEMTTDFDDQGRVWRSSVFSVNETTGAISTASLKSQNWYDHRGSLIKSSAPGGLVTKYVYDGAGRIIKQFMTDGGGDSTWDNAKEEVGDIVLQQSETQYDPNGNVIVSIDRMRFHDASAPGGNSGDLSLSPASGSARSSYQVFYYDRANRLTDSVDAGTDGGSAYSRPSTAPTDRTDIPLITHYAYNDAGEVETVTDPRAIDSKTYYDLAGRTIKTIANYVDGVAANAADDQITEYTFDGEDHILTMKAVINNSGTNNVFQTTQYVYGVTTSGGSDLNSNDLLAQTIYPDVTSGSPGSGSNYTEAFKHNAVGDTTASTDRDGNVHTFGYDDLGRMTSDTVTTLGTNVDGSIRRMDYTFDTAGRAFQFTSRSGTSSSSTIVNQVQRQYNGLGQMITEYQEHAGAVDTGTSSKVQYAYSEMPGSGTNFANHSRLTGITYPNGRIVRYEYGDSGSIDSRTSRLSFLADDDHGSIGIHLAEYSYLGLSTVVKEARPETGTSLTYIKDASDTVVGDAGDQYKGLDRFGRIIDQRWDHASGTNHSDTDRFQYAYDRDSNPLYKKNTLSSSFSELYHANGTNAGYDHLNRLTTMSRGTLSDADSDGVYDTVSSLNTLAGSGKSWTLDAVGNWDSSSSAAGTNSASVTTRTHDKQNEVTAIGGNSLTFDHSGNTTTDETGQTFKYDAWNRLVAGSNNPFYGLDGYYPSGGTQYRYDALGRQIQRSQFNWDAADDNFYSSQWQVLEERHHSNLTEFCTSAFGEDSESQYVWSPTYVDDLILRDRHAGNDPGSADATFSAASSGISSGHSAVAMTPSGKIVVAGTASSDFAVAVYNADGSLDTSFSSDGKVSTDIGTSTTDAGYAVAVQGDGKIIVAGSSAGNFAVVRYNADGSLDSTFGDVITGVTHSGKTAFDMGGTDAVYGITIDGDGKIVLAGTDGGSNFAVARLTSTGALDTTFNSSTGKKLFDFGDTVQVARAVAVQPDGKIVVIGWAGDSDGTGGDFAIARLTTAGVLDNTFNSTGLETTDQQGQGYDDQAHALVIEADGSIIAAGYATKQSIIGYDEEENPIYHYDKDAAVLRYDSAGSVTGSEIFNFSADTMSGADADDAIDAVTTGLDGKIIFAGVTSSVLARLNADLTLDTTFGTDGVTSGGGGESVVLDGPYRIVVDFGGSVERYNNDLSERLYAQQDANHNTTSITDAAGTVKERFVYDPYRNSTVLTSAFASTSDAYSFIVRSQGEREDSVTNTIDGRSRFYGLGIGRWMQEDFARYINGFNLYQFAQGSPVGLTDPFGMDVDDDKPAPAGTVDLELVPKKPELAPWTFKKFDNTKDTITEGRTYSRSKVVVNIVKVEGGCLLSVKMRTRNHIFINDIFSIQGLEKEADQKYGHEQRHVKQTIADANQIKALAEKSLKDMKPMSIDEATKEKQKLITLLREKWDNLESKDVNHENTEPKAHKDYNPLEGGRPPETKPAPGWTKDE